MTDSIYDTRITEAQPLITPWVLAEELPLSEEQASTVARARQDIAQSLAGRDHRLVVIAGPCSVHDPDALIDFATRYKSACATFSDVLLPVLRVYFETKQLDGLCLVTFGFSILRRPSLPF